MISEGSAALPRGSSQLCRDLSLDARICSAEQCRRDRLGRLWVGQRPAFRRLVQRQPEGRVAGRGHRGCHPQSSSDLARQPVGAMMPAQERDHRRAVLGHSEDRRLVALVAQQRRQGPDQDAGGAHAHDGDAVAEQALEMRHQLLEADVGGACRTGRGMDARARQRLAQAFGQRLAAGAEGDDGDLCFMRRGGCVRR